MKLTYPLSYSSVTTYEDCPRRFQQRYVVRVPQKPKHFFSYGRSLHGAVEYFYSGEKPPTMEALLMAYERGWVRDGYRDVHHEAECFDEGKDLVRRFWEKHRAAYRKPVATELKFDVKLGGVPFTGKVDRVDALRGGVGILDYKTGRPIEPGRVEVDAQLSTYQAAVELALKKAVRELGLYHLPTLTYLPTKRRTTKQVEAVVKRIQKVARCVRADEFAPTPSDETCRFCDYKIGCPAMQAGTKSEF